MITKPIVYEVIKILVVCFLKACLYLLDSISPGTNIEHYGTIEDINLPSKAQYKIFDITDRF